MELDDYRRIFEQVRADLKALRDAKDKVEAHIAQLNIQIDALVQTHNALAPLVGQEPLQVSKATDTSVEAITSATISHAVRLTLDARQSETFTAAAMRDQLALQGWDWSKYANPLATINTVLVRLAKAGHAIQDTRMNPDGAKSFYSARRVPAGALQALASVGPHKAPPVPDTAAAKIAKNITKGWDK